MAGNRYWGDDDDDAVLNAIDNEFERYERENPDED
jgi:hypothetical protein